MNSSDSALNMSSSSFPQLLTPSSVPSTASLSPSVSPLPPGAHDPRVTITVVLGLTAVLAVVAAFLAVCRHSGREGNLEGGCGPGESLASGPSSSGEPQLKVWKRLGSYRRSYNMSFRRPPQRRPERCAPPRVAQADPTLDLHLTMPCLFDYVTEI
ncbi:uncharacterized protein FYW47_012132 [Aplochiton taeniatus]